MKYSKWYLLLLIIPIAFLIVFAVVRSKESSKPLPVERQARPESPGRLTGQVKSVDLNNKTIEVQTDSEKILLYVDERTHVRVRVQGEDRRERDRGKKRGPDVLSMLKKGMPVDVRYREVEGKKVIMRLIEIDRKRMEDKTRG